MATIYIRYITAFNFFFQASSIYLIKLIVTVIV